MSIFIWLSILVSFIFSSQEPYPTVGKIEVLDPEMNHVIAVDAPIEIIGEGMKWAEGPVWVKEFNYLLFSDPSQNIIYKWDKDNKLQEFLKPAGYAGEDFYSDEPGTNGLLINHQGELIACDHGNRRLSQISLTDKKSTALIDRWDGKKFNSPNDLCQHPNGDYYFTDPPYGLPARTEDTTNREIQQNGVYLLNKKGELTQIIKNLDRPNGIALSADGKTLFVALSDGNKPFIMAYNITKDGQVDQGKVYFDFAINFPNENLAADGIKVDSKGFMYAAAGDGIIIINPQGKPIGRIRSGVRTANCALATDGYLYMTASDKLLRVKIKNKGI